MGRERRVRLEAQGVEDDLAGGEGSLATWKGLHVSLTVWQINVFVSKSILYYGTFKTSLLLLA